ncbi:hypothetical protein DF186_19630, partial [Enterococcus hirae]
QLVARLDEHLAGFLVDDVGGDVAAQHLLVGDELLLKPDLLQLVGKPGGDLGAGLGHHLAGLGIDQIVRQLDAAQRLVVDLGLPAV